MKKLLSAILLLSLTTIAISQTTGKVNQTRELNAFTSVELQMPATVYITQSNSFNVQVTSASDLLDKINTVVEGDMLKIYTSQKDFWKLKADVVIRISMPKPNKLHVLGSGIINIETNLITDYLSLEVHGSGIIKGLDSKVSKMQIGVYGSGIIKLQNIVADGIVEEVDGSGIIENVSIACNLASLNQSGSGIIKTSQINALSIEADGAGSGNIEMKKGITGNIVMQTAGSGSIIASDVVGQTVSANLAGSGNISITVLDSLDATIAGSGNINYKGNPKSISKAISGSGSVRNLN